MRSKAQHQWQQGQGRNISTYGNIVSLFGMIYSFAQVYAAKRSTPQSNDVMRSRNDVMRSYSAALRSRIFKSGAICILKWHDLQIFTEKEGFGTAPALPKAP